MKPIEAPDTFPARLHRLRRGKHMTQSGLAAVIGCSQTTIASWEAGRHCPMPNSVHMRKLAQALGTTPLYLLAGDVL